MQKFLGYCTIKKVKKSFLQDLNVHTFSLNNTVLAVFMTAISMSLKHGIIKLLFGHSLPLNLI